MGNQRRSSSTFGKEGLMKDLGKTGEVKKV
jgi:hypothetical protein